MPFIVDKLAILDSEVGEVISERVYLEKESLSHQTWTRTFLERLNDADRSPLLKRDGTRTICGGRSHSIEPAIKLLEGLYVISILRNGIILSCLVTFDNPPIVIVTVLHKIYEVLQHYFGQPLTVEALKADKVTLQLVLGEVIDGGLCGILEPGVLESIIPMPNRMDKMVTAVTGKLLPEGQLTHALNKGVTSAFSALSSALAPSPSAFAATEQLCASDEIWWRRADITHASNEIYVDVVEKLNAIVSASGRVLNWSICGNIITHAKLSGNTPEVVLTIKEPRAPGAPVPNRQIPEGVGLGAYAASLDSLFNWGLHVSVKKPRWIRDKVLAFVPPDGKCSLAQYVYSPFFLGKVDSAHAGGALAAGNKLLTEAPLPVTLIAHADFDTEGGKVDIQVAPRLVALVKTAQTEKVIEPLVLRMFLPSCVGSATLVAKSGSASFDKEDHCIMWNVGKLSSADSTPVRLDGTVKYSPDIAKVRAISQANIFTCTISLEYTIKSHVCTGLKVESLEVLGVPYSPYKGVRYSSQSGQIEYRL